MILFQPGEGSFFDLDTQRPTLMSIRYRSSQDTDTGTDENFRFRRIVRSILEL